MADGPKIGEQVDYVSPFRTGTYDGVVAAINRDGTVALNVYLPNAGTSRRHDLSPTITLRSVTYGPQARARPRT